MAVMAHMRCPTSLIWQWQITSFSSAYLPTQHISSSHWTQVRRCQGRILLKNIWPYKILHSSQLPLHQLSGKVASPPLICQFLWMLTTSIPTSTAASVVLVSYPISGGGWALPSKGEEEQSDRSYHSSDSGSDDEKSNTNSSSEEENKDEDRGAQQEPESSVSHHQITPTSANSSPLD